MTIEHHNHHRITPHTSEMERRQVGTYKEAVLYKDGCLGIAFDGGGIILPIEGTWELLDMLYQHRDLLYKLSQHQEPDPERLDTSVAAARQEYQRLLQEQRGGIKPLLLKDAGQIDYQELRDELERTHPLVEAIEAANTTDEEDAPANIPDAFLDWWRGDQEETQE